MSDAALLNSALAGRYEVDREIGAGGMATVYLARDLRHDRRVALKVLRPELSAILGADRFLKEIRTTANLQHPHILPLHDSGNANGLVFYVMPFVEGESLRDRIVREKQLAIDDAVRIAKEVAGALDYAHRQGVVHRDIKPENILLHDGQALVADFGIALAASTAGGSTRMTETGMSLGTPHYMSPEQAMGEREITARSDVYALGCVLYEMLLGEPPFTGPTAQAIIARVVTEDPRSLTAQRKTIPPHVEAAVWTALAKLPADRFGSAAEFAAALATPSYTGTHARFPASAAPPTHRRWLTDPRTLATLGLAAAGVIAAVVLGLGGRGAEGDAATTRLTISPNDTTRSSAALAATSPDGGIVAFSVLAGDTSMLYVQPLDSFDQWTVAGGGRSPFFSPDGKWIGFRRGNIVWKVSSAGGDPVRIGTLDEQPWNFLGSGVWHPNGQIYFGTGQGMLAIPAAGGSSRMVARGDSGGRVFIGPVLMPDGRLMGTFNDGPRRKLAVLSIEGENPKPVVLDFAETGSVLGNDILVYRREGQVYASRFDLGSLELEGEAIPITERGDVLATAGPTVAWPLAPTTGRHQPVWVTRDGKVTPTVLPIGNYRWPRISPDGRQLAIGARGDNAISVVDVATGGKVLLVAPSGDGAGRTEPVWFRGTRRVLTSLSVQSQEIGFISQLADATQPPDTIRGATNVTYWPTDIDRGDSLVLYYGPVGDDHNDVSVYNLRTKTSRRIMLPGLQKGGRFSPDGRWIAMESLDLAGRSEVVVQPWPALNARYTITGGQGGDHPVWSRDGRELYFRSGDAVMAVKVSAGSTWTPSAPSVLFSGPYARDAYGDQSFDVGPDGRFLMLREGSNTRVQIRVIRNWSAELERRLPR